MFNLFLVNNSTVLTNNSFNDPFYTKYLLFHRKILDNLVAWFEEKAKEASKYTK